MYLGVIIHECRLRNVFHMSVSERLHYDTTSGWCRLNKYCRFFTLKDVACILTYAPGSATYQTIREIMSFEGKLLSSSLLTHYITERSVGRNLAGGRGEDFWHPPM